MDRNVQFTVRENPEPDDETHKFLIIVTDAADGKELQSFYAEDPEGFIAAYREVDSYDSQEEMYAHAAEMGL